jgi:thiol-disulfide isomerase/thioredoxin
MPAVATAQPADEPAVRAVLFYSPTCPHCHEVIQNTLIPMVDRYGDRLQILAIDVTRGPATLSGSRRTLSDSVPGGADTGCR